MRFRRGLYLPIDRGISRSVVSTSRVSVYGSRRSSVEHKAFVVYQANNVVTLRRRVIRDHAVAPSNGANDMLRKFPLNDLRLLDQAVICRQRSSMQTLYAHYSCRELRLASWILYSVPTCEI